MATSENFAIISVNKKLHVSSFSVKVINTPKKLLKNRSFYIFTNRQLLGIIYDGKLTAARQIDYLVKYQSYDICYIKIMLCCVFLFAQISAHKKTPLSESVSPRGVYFCESEL